MKLSLSIDRFEGDQKDIAVLLTLSATSVWLVFGLIAFAVGAVREIFLRPRVGEPTAHVIGTLIAVTLVALVIVAYVRRIQASCSRTDLLGIGVLWLVLTVAFEFLFFQYVVGRPWEALLADYNVLRGRIWVLVLATVLLWPIVVGTLMRRGHQTLTPPTGGSSPADESSR